MALAGVGVLYLVLGVVLTCCVVVAYFFTVLLGYQNRAKVETLDRLGRQKKRLEELEAQVGYIKKKFEHKISEQDFEDTVRLFCTTPGKAVKALAVKQHSLSRKRG